MADSNELLHIFYNKSGISEPYTGRGGGSNPEFGKKIREHHGPKLMAQFNKAWEDLLARRTEYSAIAISEKHAVNLEFEIVPGYEQVIQSLDLRRSKIEMLSVREDVIDGEKRQIANVRIPIGKQHIFLKKIAEYITLNKSKSKLNEPKHQSFVESIESIRAALTRSFWTDAPELYPSPDENIWWEVWLSTRDTFDVIGPFIETAKMLEFEIPKTEFVSFPERIVFLLKGTSGQMAVLIDHVDYIAELKRAKDAAFFLEMKTIDQPDWVEELISRTNFTGDFSNSICILDTGIVRNHPLLLNFLSPTDEHVYDVTWSTHDVDGHGTAMAGIALFGDLAYPLGHLHQVDIPFHLESAKMIPHGNFVASGYDFGAITTEMVSRVEIQAPQISRRVFCTAVSSRDGREFGRPSVWSATVDKLCAGVSEQPQRLFIVAAGNLEESNIINYPSRNYIDDLHDPAQAWNALTVGAYTQKIHITEQKFNGFTPVAPHDDLCPSSTTSQVWDRKKWPNKPDVVLEGGNYAFDPARSYTTRPDSLQLVTTSRYPGLGRFFQFMGDTSASTADASRMAAYIWDLYPDYWPETIRALIIHSALWTTAMWNQALRMNKNASYQQVFDFILSVYGYGVPNMHRALWSARNQLTLILQDSIQPFENKGDYISFKEMNTHELAWPTDILLSLGETEVTMKVTLSYYIEPGPGNRGFTQRYRYASHGLRFDVRRANESTSQFRKFLNMAAREQDEELTSRPKETGRWILGPKLRHRGSVHSDIWKGTAADLARRGMIGIYPITGWWRERKHLNRWNSSARYSLIVSIETPDVSTDIYTPVQIQTEIPTVIEV